MKNIQKEQLDNQLKRIEGTISSIKITLDGIIDTCSAGKAEIVGDIFTNNEGIRIELRDAKLNWLEFITIKLNRYKYGEKLNELEFTFDNRTGGFNEADPDDVLQSSICMLNIARQINKNKKIFMKLIDSVIELVKEYHKLLKVQNV